MREKRDFCTRLFNDHKRTEWMPVSSEICQFTQGILEGLFPAIAEIRFSSIRELEHFFETHYIRLEKVLKSLESKLDLAPEDYVERFQQEVPAIYDLMVTDIKAITAGDPAAKNEYEVVRAYPGFYAIAMYRIAHAFFRMGIPLLPRIITEFAHSKTGIDIHPGAQIGAYFFIDHGTGVVIGETCEIGTNVKVYQGVTLGALSVSKDMANQKRHPSIEDDVIIYAGATILGGETIIGKGSVVGGNVWLTKSIPANTRVYHQAQVKVLDEQAK